MVDTRISIRCKTTSIRDSREDAMINNNEAFRWAFKNGCSEGTL